MNGRTAKALRKVFKAKDNPENFKEFKRALNHADPETRKHTLQMARDIVKSGKPINRLEVKRVRN
jgi:hypothetical protein